MAKRRKEYTWLDGHYEEVPSGRWVLAWLAVITVVVGTAGMVLDRVL